MNNILQLKGTFQQRASEGRPGYANIPKKSDAVRSKHLKKLADSLENLRAYWAGEKTIEGALIDVHYTRVVAKSNRISSFFCRGQVKSNNTVVGARFSPDVEKKHVITHYVDDAMIGDAIEKLRKTAALLDDAFEGSIDDEQLESLGKLGIDFSKYGLARSGFCSIVADAFYIEGFDIPDNSTNTQGQSIITIYKTDGDAVDVMKRIGITVPVERLISDTTMLLRPPQIMLLKEKAPYLIAMATEDISKLNYDDVVEEHVEDSGAKTIDSPTDEPTIGVIDTMFDDRVYFSEWVDFKKMIDDEIPLDQDDYDHGTAVSSIIVDGPSINPHLDDGCGRFKVRHFGVAAKGQYSAFNIMRSIQQIVEENPDIKVWNLSLGSDTEINLNSISPEAAILDKLQYEKDVLFIVAGTNKHDLSVDKRIGAPADSINSIVVNSINGKGTHASYSRKGLVLSFFNKPDVSSHGGDKATGDFIRVCAPGGESFRTGTSFAAPWVTRKAAYLIEVLGFSREVAKALIVDSASGWNDTGSDQSIAPLVGHGPVPIRIEDVVRSHDDEIRFVINGVSEMYDTYTYNLPVPTHNDKYPFVAKATLCYFPKCSINQGVDYTNTELDFYIGRVNSKGVQSVNKNSQSTSDGESHYIYEGEARKWYRKWDNTKHVRESYGERLIPRKVLDSGMWGISLKTKERLGTRDGEGLKFGLVVTLKEMNGVNRISDFIRQCELRGWLVTKVDVEAQVDIYNRAQETLTFDK